MAVVRMQVMRTEMSHECHCSDVSGIADELRFAADRGKVIAADVCDMTDDDYAIVGIDCNSEDDDGRMT